MEASGGMILIRMRLSGGSQVAGESRAAAAGIAETGAAATAADRRTSRATSGIGRSIRSVLSNSMKLRAVGRSMSTFISLPILAAGAYAVHTAMEFDTSMAQVKAATGIGSDGLDELRQLALKMGADTIFSANEAAQAMLELVKGGMTPAQVKAGALDASLQLAAAGGIDLAVAANQVTRSMNTFGLPASKATSIANALAGAANASSADLSDMSLAMSQAGQSAHAAGFTINETAGILGAFADAGIIGSDAGTSLKVMLQRLVPQSADAASMMKQYNLDFFDANGSMKSATEIAAILQKGLGKLSQEERSAAMAKIFGSDATRAATILMNQGADGLAKYIKATQDNNAAQKMADARMQGLSGAIETMKGSLQTAALTFGEALKPAIVAVAGIITVLANKFAGLPPEVQTGIAIFLVLIALLGPMIFLLGTAAAAATALGVSLGTFLVGVGIVAGVVAIVIALGVAFYIAYQRVGWFHRGVDRVFHWMKAHLPLLAAILIGAFATGFRVILNGLGNFISSMANRLGGPGATGRMAGAGARSGRLFGVAFRVAALGAAVLFVYEFGQYMKAHGFQTHITGHGNTAPAGPSPGGGYNAPRLPGPLGSLQDKILGAFGARGVVNATGGPMIVGEEGPEMWWMPKGSNLMPAGPTRRWQGEQPEIRGAKKLPGVGARTRGGDRRPIIVQVKGRTIAEITAEEQADEDARR